MYVEVQYSAVYMDLVVIVLGGGGCCPIKMCVVCFSACAGIKNCMFFLPFSTCDTCALDFDHLVFKQVTDFCHITGLFWIETGKRFKSGKRCKG